MRKTKPPVGWEHVKNCFPVPNILLDMDLPASAVAVYLYLLRSADGLIPAPFRCCDLLIGKPVKIVESQSSLLCFRQLCDPLM